MTGAAQDGQTDFGPAGKPFRRLVFHIGDHKTGSTAIQQALLDGRIKVDGQTPFYAPSGRFLNHNYICQYYEPDQADPAKAEARLRKLATRIARSNATVSVISAEQFENIEIDSFQRITERYFSGIADEIRIVAYVRPHAQRLLSSYVERIKIGNFFGTLDEFHRSFLRQNSLVYHARFCRWRALYGDAFVLRPFVGAELIEGSLLQDFARSAFPEARVSIETGAGERNESLSLQDLMRVKYIHRHLTPRSRHMLRHMGWSLSLILGDIADSDQPEKVQLHLPLAKKIARIYRKDARALDRDFFSGAPIMEGALSVACDQAIAKRQPSRPETVFSASELRSLEMASRLVAAMLENGEDTDWAQLFRRFRGRPSAGAQTEEKKR